TSVSRRVRSPNRAFLTAIAKARKRIDDRLAVRAAPAWTCGHSPLSGPSRLDGMPNEFVTKNKHCRGHGPGAGLKSATSGYEMNMSRRVRIVISSAQDG